MPQDVGIVKTGTPPAEKAGVLVMRRLTYREYDHMLADLLGDTTAPAEGGNAWSPDAQNAVGLRRAHQRRRSAGRSLYNQTADTVVDTAVQALATGKAAGKLSTSLPSTCQAPSGTSAETTCATQFITTFGQAAYRRPVAAAEQTDLLKVFSTVRGLGLSFTASIGALAKAMLQSPNFLYHWEIGPTAPKVGSDGLVPLTPWQVASRLASTLWETDAGRRVVASRAVGAADDAGAGLGAGDAPAGRPARRQWSLQLPRAVAVQLRQPGARL